MGATMFAVVDQPSPTLTLSKRVISYATLLFALACVAMCSLLSRGGVTNTGVGHDR